MGKKNVPIRTRFIVIGILSFLLAVDILLLIILGIAGIKVNYEVINNTYHTKSEIQYDLSFVDNPFYNQNNLEFGTGYVTKFIDTIQMTFLYDFDSGAAENIKSNYTVTALLEGAYNSADLIWQKEYPLITERSFTSGHDKTTWDMRVSSFRELATNLEQSTGVKTSALMTVTYTVNTTAMINGKPVSETSVSTLVFDLYKDVLIMDGEPVSELTKNVTETIQRDLVPKGTVLYTGIPFFVVFAGSLLYVLLYTAGVRPDPVEVELKSICKRYGGRIIELGVIPRDTIHETIQTKTFRDLLLIADEVKKPIFKNSAEALCKTEFHVIDGNQKYMYRVSRIKIDANIQDKVPTLM